MSSSIVGQSKEESWNISKNYPRKELSLFDTNAPQQLFHTIWKIVCCCCGFWLVFFVIVTTFIVFGHNITCIFHKEFCTPLSEYIYKFPCCHRHQRHPYFRLPLLVVVVGPQPTILLYLASALIIIPKPTGYIWYFWLVNPERGLHSLTICFNCIPTFICCKRNHSTLLQTKFATTI